MKMHVLDCGTQKLDKGLLVAGCPLATIDNPDPKAIWQEIPIHTFLIESADGYVLFDTACSPDWKTKWPQFMFEQSPVVAINEEHSLLNRLDQLGVKPDDIGTVVISHLHNDHAGHLRYFKKATVYVNDAELTTTLRQYCLGEGLNVHVPVDIEAFLAAGLSWRPVMADEAEVDIAPGLKILNLGSGHSWGMLTLRVDLEKSGTFLLVADALYMAENAGPPIRVPGIIHDSVGFARSAKFLVDYAKKHNATILYGHDKEQFRTLRKAPGAYYD